MRRYFGRKILVYAITLWVAVTINWMLPRIAPGDPVRAMLSRASVGDSEAYESIHSYYTQLFGLDQPLWQQYLNYWLNLFRGELGISISQYPRSVTDIILASVPYTLALVLPAILVSFYIGNKFGAFAARSRFLDKTMLPASYILTATPYMWLAILLAWSLGIVAGIFPTAGGYSFLLTPAFSWPFISSLLMHWFLPFLSVLLVALGGWAIGMRNMIIYELESDYSNYLEALGAPRRLIRKYAFRNAMLPQITGLALQLGVIIGGNLLTEIVFAYPGLGSLILSSVTNRDYFLLQGVVIFIIIGVLLANFIIDLIYVVVDPRTRTQMQGVSA